MSALKAFMIATRTPRVGMKKVHFPVPVTKALMMILRNILEEIAQVLMTPKNALVKLDLRDACVSREAL